MTKSLEQVQKEIAELQALEVELLNPKPKYLQRAEKGGLYFSVGAGGECHGSADVYLPVDNDIFNTGNYFLKRTHAELKAIHNVRVGPVQRLIIEFNDGWEPNWDDHTRAKGGVFFNHRISEWATCYTYCCENIGVIYFDYTRRDELLELLNQHFPNGPE